MWDLSVSWDSTHLLTASADASAKMWDVQTGECLQTFRHHGPVKSVDFAEGAERFVTVSDPFSEHPGSIQVYECPRDLSPSEWDEEPLMLINIPGRGKATRAVWGAFNDTIIISYEDGSVAIVDPSSGEEKIRQDVHSKTVNRLTLNKDRTLAITCSKDYTAKLLDASTLEVLQTYQTDRPVNAAIIHPIHEHILLGGGQDAMNVTTTSSKAGKFETRFYHMIYAEEFGRVKGHFGPVNALGISPTGNSYCSGAEDGYIRLHHFDQAYLDWRDEVPDEVEQSDGEDDGEDDLLKPELE